MAIRVANTAAVYRRLFVDTYTNIEQSYALLSEAFRSTGFRCHLNMPLRISNEHASKNETPLIETVRDSTQAVPLHRIHYFAPPFLPHPLEAIIFTSSVSFSRSP
jgi:hypothetical protein